MRNVTRLAAVAVVAGVAAGALAQPASAAPCVGEQSTFYVCAYLVDVGVGSTPLCVYTGGPTCRPVDVPTPTVTGCPGFGWGGSLAPDDYPFYLQCTG